MTYASGHPDPVTHAPFYDGVPTKRLIAWLLDLAFTALLIAPLALPLLAVGILLVFPLLLIPVLWTVVGFLYRWFTISNRSATWGMRIMAIELRGNDGHRVDAGTAFLHTLGTTISFAIPVVQVVSAVMMAAQDKGQGLTDMVLGTAMLNRAA